MRYELSDYERCGIKPILPNKPRGMPRVDDRRVLNGIVWILRSGAPWRDLPFLQEPAGAVRAALDGALHPAHLFIISVYFICTSPT
jgi:transposase